MDQNKTLFALYKYDFHKAAEQMLEAEDEPPRYVADKNVKIAQRCFASLFDQGTINNLVKSNKKGETIPLANDVLATSNGIMIWRVNNSLIRELWLREGKDQNGIDTYNEEELISMPYCHVLIDNRPGVCLMAIEKSTAWNNKPDILRNKLLENFNRILVAKFGIEMRIEARMNPVDVWNFVHDRIYVHHDYVRKVSFSFQNPKRINKTGDMDVKSERLKAMLDIAEISNALKSHFTMEYDQSTTHMVSQKNRDLAEMVHLCSRNGYDISITFNEYQTYRINDYVKTYYPMPANVLLGSATTELRLDGRTELQAWFDTIIEETKNYINESEIPRRRNKHRS